MTLGAAAVGGMLVGMLCQIMVVPALFYIFQMWAGRLEFMTLFALIVEVVASLVPRPRPKERS